MLGISAIDLPVSERRLVARPTGAAPPIRASNLAQPFKADATAGNGRGIRFKRTFCQYANITYLCRYFPTAVRQPFAQLMVNNEV